MKLQELVNLCLLKEFVDRAVQHPNVSNHNHLNKINTIINNKIISEVALVQDVSSLFQEEVKSEENLINELNKLRAELSELKSDVKSILEIYSNKLTEKEDFIQSLKNIKGEILPIEEDLEDVYPIDNPLPIKKITKKISSSNILNLDEDTINSPHNAKLNENVKSALKYLEQSCLKEENQIPLDVISGGLLPDEVINLDGSKDELISKVIDSSNKHLGSDFNDFLKAEVNSSTADITKSNNSSFPAEKDRQFMPLSKTYLDAEAIRTSSPEHIKAAEKIKSINVSKNKANTKPSTYPTLNNAYIEHEAEEVNSPAHQEAKQLFNELKSNDSKKRGRKSKST